MDSVNRQLLPKKGGADIIIVETMSAIDEASLAVIAARENTKCTVKLQ